jgi:hypothetical protein
MSEGQEKALMGLERNFKILEDVIDVTTQTKRLVKDTTHLDICVKRFKEMAKAQKRRKKNRR